MLIALLACAGAILLLRAALRGANAPLAAGLTTIVLNAAYLLLVPALFAVNGRYRWPVEDVCMPLAAVALSWMTRAGLAESR